ncbi:MAG: hypothetical protein OXG04_19290 [Acidobacteria bacterium]|nr:hypothetical protein [Acidobacteriota bacterium]
MLLSREIGAGAIPAFHGPAFEYYGPLQSEQALGHAGDIVEFVCEALDA